MATKGRTAAIVLCGGRSTRMGRDKASLPFGPETLLERTIRLVTAVTPDIVVAAAPGQVVPGAVVVSRDTAPGTGPLPALLAALDHLDAELVCVVACDLPLLRPALLAALVGWCDGWEAAVPVVGGRQVPTCAVYRRDALLTARASIEDPRHKSLRSLLAMLTVREVGEDLLRSVDPALVSFTPCNTAEEYEEVKSEK